MGRILNDGEKLFNEERKNMEDSVSDWVKYLYFTKKKKIGKWYIDAFKERKRDLEISIFSREEKAKDTKCAIFFWEKEEKCDEQESSNKSKKITKHL